MRAFLTIIPKENPAAIVVADGAKGLTVGLSTDEGGAVNVIRDFAGRLQAS
jgi:hypothetical protein